MTPTDDEPATHDDAKPTATTTPTPTSVGAATPAAAAAHLRAELEQWLREDRLELGAEWFVVNARWWRPEETETEINIPETHTADVLAPVRNAPLVDEAASSRRRTLVVLRPRLAEGRDYRLVSERVWNRLSDVVGADWAIPRPVVARGPARQLVVDVYPTMFQLWLWRNGLDAPVPVPHDDGDDRPQHERDGGDKQQTRAQHPTPDAKRRPWVVLASETTPLAALERQLHDALLPRARALFPRLPHATGPGAVLAELQVAYRVDARSPWRPLASAAGADGDDPDAAATATPTLGDLLVGDLALEPRDYKDGPERFHDLLVEERFHLAHRRGHHRRRRPRLEDPSRVNNDQGIDQIGQTDAPDRGHDAMGKDLDDDDDDDDDEDEDDDAEAAAAVAWMENRFYSDIRANVWRFELQVGQLIDALDTDRKWYESRVLHLTPDRVRVHYRGWTAKWDEWLDRLSPRLAPLHTRVPNWRAFRVGDAVQVGAPLAHRAYPEWRNATVVAVETSSPNTETTNATELDTDASPVITRIRVRVDAEEKWMDAQDELLCRPGTHKAVNVVQSSPASSSSSPSTILGRPLGTTLSTPTYYHHHRRDYGADYGRGRPSVVGVVGLQNLGNTCFMNSMLQCLINTRPLRDYFLATDAATGAPRFEHDINEANPLGMKGMIAREFAKLIRRMWGGEYAVVSPTGLKAVIGQYAPQFAGYQQQDSQEVMNFILDGLHEDLNRVRQKPYTTPIEHNGRPDAVVAREEWQQYLRRNDSVIVEHFMGQLRSHVTCSNSACANESITFDPFMSLSVPIPSDESVVVRVQVFWADGGIPTKYAVWVNKDATVGDVKLKLGPLAGVPASHLFFVEVRHHRIKKALRDATAIDDVADELLHVYQLEHAVDEYEFCSSNLRPTALGIATNGVTTAAGPKPMRLVALLHQAPVASPMDHDAALDEPMMGPKHRRVEVELFNTPLLISINGELTKSEIHRRVWQVVRRLVADDSAYGCSSDQGLPYRLHVTQPSGTIPVMRDFARADEPSGLPDGGEANYCFTLEWSRQGYQQGYDVKSAKRIELHESMHRLRIAPDEVSLLNCLSKFTEREQLGQTDTWYCPKCKEHVRAYKKFDLFKLPRVLIFQLKRFRYAQSSFYMHRDKITTQVTFPIDHLDLSDYVVGPRPESGLVYDLFAVSEHSGGLGGGHYTAVAKNPDNGRWFSFNDSMTSSASAADAVTPRAYVLFYIRRE